MVKTSAMPSITVKTAFSMPKYMSGNDPTYQVSNVRVAQLAESNRYEKFFVDNILYQLS